MNEIRFDIRKVFYGLIPSIMDLSLESPVDWKRINQLVGSWMYEYAQTPETETIREEFSIYTISLAVLKNNRQALGLFSFFNRLFQELTQFLTQEEKKLIAKTIFNLLTNFDHKYLNFVGEIAVLNQLIKSGSYRLLEIEAEIGNGKSIDFKLLQKATTEEIFVEVLNIHIDEDKAENDPEKIKKFFDYRIEKKYKEKTRQLEGFPLRIIPVIWSSAESLEIYSSFFKTNSLSAPYSTEPVSFITKILYDYSFSHTFGRVSKLFDN